MLPKGNVTQKHKYHFISNDLTIFFSINNNGARRFGFGDGSGRAPDNTGTITSSSQVIFSQILFCVFTSCVPQFIL